MPQDTVPLPPEFQERITAATAELAGAEQDLRTTLEAIPSALRAEKRIISRALQAALEKLASAKQRLEGALAESSPGPAPGSRSPANGSQKNETPPERGLGPSQ